MTQFTFTKVFDEPRESSQGHYHGTDRLFNKILSHKKQVLVWSLVPSRFPLGSVFTSVNDARGVQRDVPRRGDREEETVSVLCHHCGTCSVSHV